MDGNDTLAQLVAMSNELGSPTHDYAILGEGNTSALADDETFWVKASGTHLGTLNEGDLVRVSFERVLRMLDGPNLTDEEIKQQLMEAKIAPASPAEEGAGDGIRPSVETVFHAICLSLDGVNFVGHTHPTAINAITCSSDFEKAVSGRLFPDEIVVCGPAPVIVPYTDPGLPLARAIRDSINGYIEERQELPRAVLVQNHGLIALGQTSRQVLNITAMAVKTAQVLLGTYQIGGPRFLTEAEVDRIHTRPDEAYRRKVLKG